MAARDGLSGIGSMVGISGRECFLHERCCAVFGVSPVGAPRGSHPARRGPHRAGRRYGGRTGGGREAGILLALGFYDGLFAERDTRLWTVGPHLEWAITPRVDMTLGYHYERGLADGRHAPQFNDDISYINHYVSWELGIRLTGKTSVAIGLDYERNDFTSELAADDRRGSREDVYQGDVKLRHAVADAMALTVGVQRSQRETTPDRRSVSDINVWIGGDYQF